MKKMIVILIVLMLSGISFGKSKYPDIDKKWDRAKVEQRHRFANQIREARQRGRINMIKAYNNQRVRRRYGRKRRSHYYIASRSYRGGSL